MQGHAISNEAISVVDRKKQQNLKIILSKAFFGNQFTISTVAKTIHTSIPSATAYVNELLEEGWLVEAEATATSSGRRPSNFELNPDKKKFFIVDINTRTSTFYVTNLARTIISRKQLSLPINIPDFANKLAMQIDELIAEYGSPWAIGISSPGLIDKSTEVNLTYPDHNVNGKAISDWLSERVGIPAFLINDTRASLLGENRFGYVKKKKNVVLLNLDWGVGLGILTNGEVVNGSDGFAGELGHIQVKPHGKLCHCGKIGCLDTVASASAILKSIQEGLEAGETSILTPKKGSLTIDDVMNAINNGDTFAIRIATEAMQELGMGLAIVIHLLNPHTIIIDGILSQMGNLLTAILLQSINVYCIKDFRNNLDIVISPLGDLAKVYGTMAYVFEGMLENA